MEKKIEASMSQTTEHGRNIADQIQDEDAYGQKGDLTLADVWIILDNLHSHFMDTKQDTKFLEKWMHELEAIDDDLPCI
jgi:hypothetical protein